MVARSVRSFFDEPRNASLMDRLAAAGVCTQVVDVAAASAVKPLSGSTYVITGTLDSMSRDQASDRITALGGKVAGSVSAKTHFVVAGAELSELLWKLREHGVDRGGERAAIGNLPEAARGDDRVGIALTRPHRGEHVLGDLAGDGSVTDAGQ